MINKQKDNIKDLLNQLNILKQLDAKEQETILERRIRYLISAHKRLLAEKELIYEQLGIEAMFAPKLGYPVIVELDIEKAQAYLDEEKKHQAED